MNGMVKRLQSHVAHIYADYYAGKAYEENLGTRQSKNWDRATACRLLSKSLSFQARALLALEVSCAH